MDESDILKPIKWQHLNVICGKSQVTYNDFNALKYEYKSCGLNDDCPLVRFCKIREKLIKEGISNERRSKS